MKLYDEALALFHQQKFQKAKVELEKVLEGPSKELVDRARIHLKIAEQRMKPSQEQNPKSAEEHYQRGVAMMNIGRWDFFFSSRRRHTRFSRDWSSDVCSSD